MNNDKKFLFENVEGNSFKLKAEAKSESIVETNVEDNTEEADKEQLDEINLQALGQKVGGWFGKKKLGSQLGTKVGNFLGTADARQRADNLKKMRRTNIEKYADKLVEYSKNMASKGNKKVVASLVNDLKALLTKYKIVVPARGVKQ